MFRLNFHCGCNDLKKVVILSMYSLSLQSFQFKNAFTFNIGNFTGNPMFCNYSFIVKSCMSGGEAGRQAWDTGVQIALTLWHQFSKPLKQHLTLVQDRCTGAMVLHEGYILNLGCRSLRSLRIDFYLLFQH